MEARTFHGGPPGLRPGDAILPPSETGVRCSSDYGAAGTHRRDRVYLTDSLAAATMFAALHPSGRGQVYEVRPDGPLEPDPDCRAEGLSFQCPRATVVRMFKVRGKDRKRVRRALLAGRPIPETREMEVA